jgi:hypothetical protein
VKPLRINDDTFSELNEVVRTYKNHVNSTKPSKISDEVRVILGEAKQKMELVKTHVKTILEK